MKRILTALMLLPLSSFAMEKQDECRVAISLTRDGEGGAKIGSFFPTGPEAQATFIMHSRDLKNKYAYTVGLRLLKLKGAQATIKGYVSRAELFDDDGSVASGFTETITIDRKVVPINARSVMEFQYQSDMIKTRWQEEEYPVTLGLMIAKAASLAKAAAAQAKL